MLVIKWLHESYRDALAPECHTATSFRQHFRQRHQVSPRNWRKTFGDNA